MKRLVQIASLLLVVALLAGCFQTERTVRLKPDGSGTIEELVLLSAMISGLMNSADATEEKASQPGEAKEQQPAAEKKKKEMFSEEEGKARAATLGEGVTFVSFKAEKRDGFEGYRAVYAFKDINKLRLSSDPEMPGNNASAEKKDSQYSFSFTKGKQLTLVLKNNKPGTQAKAEAAPPAENKPEPAVKSEEGKDATAEAGNAEMVKMFFNGMRFADRLIIEGSVVESNATYRNGSEITLMDVDFAKAMNFTKELTQLQQAKDDSQQAKEIMKKIPGFKVDMNDELKVVFTAQKAKK